MNEEIKERIEQIRRGEVPHGYKRTKAGIMPLDWCTEREYTAKELFRSVAERGGGEKLEVLSATQDNGVIPRNLLDIDIKYNKENLSNYKRVEKGDFVISLRSFQGGIEHSLYDGLISPAYTVIKPICPISDGYYKAYFKTDDFISRLNRGTYGIRDGKQVSFTDFGDLYIHCPPLVEQEKIANILSAQDKVIELQGRLVTEKQRQKKYLMQQLLTGKQRLPGFTGEWTKKRLGDIFDTFSGGTPNRKCPEYFHGDIPWIKSGELNQGNIYFTEERITKEGLENSSAKMVSKNTLLIAMYGATAGVMACTRIDAAINQAILAFVPKTSVDILFIKESISNQIDMAVNQLTQGGQPNFNASIIQSLSIRIPKLEEQRKISEIFSCANREIDLLRASLEHEKRMKKALSQLLLTGIVRV